MNIRIAFVLPVALALAAFAGDPGVLTVADLDKPIDEPSGVAQPAEAPAPAAAQNPAPPPAVASAVAPSPASAPSPVNAPSPAPAIPAAGSKGTLARATGSEAVAAPKLPVASANTFAYPAGSQAIRHADRTLQITSPDGVVTTHPAGSRAFLLKDGSLNVVVPAAPASSPASAAALALAPAPAARPSSPALASMPAPPSAVPQVPRIAAPAVIAQPQPPAAQTSVVPAALPDRGGMGAGELESVAADGDRFVEVFYERYKRDVKASDGLFGGGPSDFQEDRFVARLNFRRNPEASFTADFGLVDAKDSEGFVPMLGGGVGKEVYSQDDIVLTLFAQAAYVFESEVKETDSWSSFLSEKVSSHAYWEYGGGLQVGKLWRHQDGSRLFTYGGLLVSFLDADGEDRYREWRRNGRVLEDYGEDTNAEEDKPIGVFGGVEWWPAGSPVSIRAEMRRISHESFSLGAGMTF